MLKHDSPAGLEQAGTAFWVAVASKYELRVDELAVLEAACRTVDMIATLDKEWLTLGKPFMTRGSMGQDVIHPLIGERRTQQSALAALLRQLKLPDEDADTEGVNQQRDAANTKWSTGRGRGA